MNKDPVEVVKMSLLPRIRPENETVIRGWDYSIVIFSINIFIGWFFLKLIIMVYIPFPVFSRTCISCQKMKHPAFIPTVNELSANLEMGLSDTTGNVLANAFLQSLLLSKNRREIKNCFKKLF